MKYSLKNKKSQNKIKNGLKDGLKYIFSTKPSMLYKNTMKEKNSETESTRVKTASKIEFYSSQNFKLAEYLFKGYFGNMLPKLVHNIE